MRAVLAAWASTATPAFRWGQALDRAAGEDAALPGRGAVAMGPGIARIVLVAPDKRFDPRVRPQPARGQAPAAGISRTWWPSARKLRPQ